MVGSLFCLFNHIYLPLNFCYFPTLVLDDVCLLKSSLGQKYQHENAVKFLFFFSFLVICLHFCLFFPPWILWLYLQSSNFHIFFFLVILIWIWVCRNWSLCARVHSIGHVYVLLLLHTSTAVDFVILQLERIVDF